MVIINIKNNKTGEIRKFVEKDGDWDHRLEWFWTEGNYGCDCNRALMFARANNEDETEAWEQGCGDGVAYSIPFVELADGTKINVEEA